MRKHFLCVKLNLLKKGRVNFRLCKILWLEDVAGLHQTEVLCLAWIYYHDVTASNCVPCMNTCRDTMVLSSLCSLVVRVILKEKFVDFQMWPGL